MSNKTNAVHYPWFKKEDIDAFFALFQNNLANFVVIVISMLGMGFPAHIVYGRVVPGAAIAVLVGNIYYAYTANRLAQKEKRTDVTALSYGISTPVMFIYLFGILAPALALTNDHDLAWKIGVAACFFGGALEALGSITGQWIRSKLPRAAMMGALSGVAFSVIGAQMFFSTFEMPVVGMAVLVIVLIGLVAKKPMPFRMPSTLFAIIIGTVLAYALGQADASQIGEGFSTFGFYLPIPTLAALAGFRELFGEMSTLIAVIVPISVYNFIETMNNVEAMAATGDDYSVSEAQLTDGVGTMLGALFGGVFPTTVYIASVGAKWANAGRGYTIINGIVFMIASTFGVVAVISAIIPLPVIAPILVFVGVSMIAQTFESVDKKHYVGVIIAMLPYLANYIANNFARPAPEAVEAMSTAIIPMSQGPMFSGIVWGALIVYMVDNQYNTAGITAFIGAALTAVGFMHTAELSFMANPEYVAGYAITGIVLFAFGAMYKKQGLLDSNIVDDRPTMTD